MPKFWIRFGLGGGFGGCGDWEEIEASDIEAASDIAYLGAREIYESYMGVHGIRDIDEIMEEEGCSEVEAEEFVNEDFESWADYQATDVEPK